MLCSFIRQGKGTKNIHIIVRKKKAALQSPLGTCLADDKWTGTESGVDLQVVALAGHVGDHLLAVAEAHQDALAVGRVGLLGLADHRLEDDALQHRVAVERVLRRPLLDVRTPLVHLQQRRHGPDICAGGTVQ